MKPIKLTMTAFGPYAKKQEIDFSKLENRKMFVISGKTGAGKTTIFDAISFAMYGKPSGDNRSAADMRSQFADPKQPTEVELLFELKGQSYFIRRAPQQQKPKARGDGMTSMSASAELYELKEDGSQLLLASNVRDTDEKMNELIGLEANQFRQILMIPQGDFQKLLTAGSQEKEKLLQKLFQTHFYKRVEDVLKEKSDVLKKEAGKALEQQSLLLKGLPAFSSTMKDLLEREDVDKRAVFGQMETDLTEMTSQQRQCQNKGNELALKRDQLVAEKERGIAIHAQFDRLEAAKQEMDHVLKQEPIVREWQKQMDDAERAEKLLAYDLLEQQAIQVTNKAEQRFREADQQKKAAEQRNNQASERLLQEKEKQPVRDQAAAHLQQLEAMKASVLDYQSAREEAVRTKEKADQAEKRGKELADQEKQLSEVLHQTNQQLQSVQTAKETFMEAAHHIEKSKGLIDLYREWQTVQQTILTHERITEEIKEQYKRKEQEAEEARQLGQKRRINWSKGHAAILAGQLQAGQPCSVCGSAHHPNPAASASDHVTDQMLEEAESRVNALNLESRKVEQKWVEAKSSLAHARENGDKLLMKLPIGFQMDQAMAELKEQEDRKSCAAEEIELKEKIEKTLLDLKGKKETLMQQIEQNQQREKIELAASFEASSVLKQLERAVPESMRDTSFFLAQWKQAKEDVQFLQHNYEQAASEAHAAHTALQSAASVWQERMEALKTAEQSKKDASAQFEQKRQEWGFASNDEYQSAKQHLEQLPLLKEKVTAFELKKRDTAYLIKELQAALHGLSRMDLEELDQRIKGINEEWAALGDQAASLQSQINETIRIRNKVEEISIQMKKAEDAYRMAGHLYDITHGKNELKITFERYVLASFLEEILVAANIRLAAMTNGRFLLERLAERSKGNAQSGLDLLVFDQYTGTSRHVKTLSGGESFKAALSLALGLAEVVQNYAGGVSLETMFVDEGFGTLDPESLDQAIETLMDIQADGRLVGVISHVPELKERIDARLEIHQSDEGSTAAFVFAGES